MRGRTARQGNGNEGVRETLLLGVAQWALLREGRFPQGRERTELGS